MKKIIICMFSSMILSLSANSQTLHLNSSNDAKVSALGSVGVSSKSSAFSVFNNVAATAIYGDIAAVGIVYGKWQPSFTNADIMSFGSYVKLNSRLSIALGYRYEALPKQDIINNEGNMDGSFTSNGMSIDLGVAYSLITNLAIGVNIRHTNVSIYEMKSSSFLADIHLFYKYKRFNGGLVINNLGSEKNLILSPVNIKVAGEYSILSDNIQHQLTSHLQLGYILPEEYASLVGGVGLEYGYISSYFIRVGYNYADYTKYTPDNVSVGIGVEFKSIALNAAYLISTNNVAGSINNTFKVGLSWTLKSK